MWFLQQKQDAQKSWHENSRTGSHDSRQLLFLKVGLGKWMFTVLEALHIVKLNLELQKASYYIIFLFYKKQSGTVTWGLSQTDEQSFPVLAVRCDHLTGTSPLANTEWSGGGTGFLYKCTHIDIPMYTCRSKHKHTHITTQVPLPPLLLVNGNERATWKRHCPNPSTYQ